MGLSGGRLTCHVRSPATMSTVATPVVTTRLTMSLRFAQTGPSPALSRQLLGPAPVIAERGRELRARLRGFIASVQRDG